MRNDENCAMGGKANGEWCQREGVSESVEFQLSLSLQNEPIRED